MGDVSGWLWTPTPNCYSNLKPWTDHLLNSSHHRLNFPTHVPQGAPPTHPLHLSKNTKVNEDSISDLHTQYQQLYEIYLNDNQIALKSRIITGTITNKTGIDQF